MLQPILIVGAGISGLVLAQYLRKEGVPFRIFERDSDLTTRGVGWGLTLHWSLPALRRLLPQHLVERLPEAYVDRAAVEAGAISTFPFFDLSTGELKGQSPKAPEWHRIRVTRQKLRELLATGIEVEWEKSFREMRQDDASVTAMFEDGSSATGRLVVACDGANSRIRRVLLPGQSDNYQMPVRILGLKRRLSHDEITAVHKLDPFFFQGTDSTRNSFLYVSFLEAPKRDTDPSAQYVVQMCVSWPYREGFLGEEAPIAVPESDEQKHQLVQRISATWAEPFRSLVCNVNGGDLIKGLEPCDFPPPHGVHTEGRATLMGDALHAMAMYRGEGANHAIVDVLDFVENLEPHLNEESGAQTLRESINRYEDIVVDRARPGVLASRQACLDAHDWPRIGKESPLLTKREMKTKFDESDMS